MNQNVSLSLFDIIQIKWHWGSSEGGLRINDQSLPLFQVWINGKSEQEKWSLIISVDAKSILCLSKPARKSIKLSSLSRKKDKWRHPYNRLQDSLAVCLPSSVLHVSNYLIMFSKEENRELVIILIVHLSCSPSGNLSWVSSSVSHWKRV